MNALLSTSVMVLLSDETGPLTSFMCAPLPLPKLLELAGAMWTGRDLSTILTANWAEKPRDYAISGPVLIITIPGTHEVAVPKKRRAPKRVQSDDVELGPSHERIDREYWRSREMRAAMRSIPAAPRTAVADTEIVITHSCGAAFTDSTFRALTLTGAETWTEGSTEIHTQTRTCRCGEAMTRTTKRLLGDK